MNRNGFFQLENKDDGLYLNVYPAVEDGRGLTLEDVIVCLDKKNVAYANVVELRRAYETAYNGQPAKISDTVIVPYSGWCEYGTQNDGMKLQMVIYPGMKDMPEVTCEEIMSDLSHMKVKYGIDEEGIKELVENKAYFELKTIATGTDPVDGYDAVLKYNFNPELTAKPKVRDDGTVDFHQLDMINHVSEGDVVAQITPENPGTPGTNIYGAPVKPKKVYRKSFKYSRNLKVSDDGTQLITLVTGHVTLEGDKIFVSDEYEIKTDVDTTTGDIQYDGNVRIRGNVIAGFKVNATGNVTVDGVIEGAEIVAGGNIILQRGIQGMNKGILKADGNIAASFIENATVIAGGDIDTDAIMHSRVNARGSIEVHGKNGYLIGGMVRAGITLTAKTVGSDMGTTTVIGVGTDPELVSRIEQLRKDLTKTAQDKQKLAQIVELLRKKKEVEGKLDSVKTELMQKTMKNMILMEQSLKAMKEEYTKNSALAHENANARIKITGSIYPGVKIEFGDRSLFIRDKNDYCQYVKKGLDIVKINL